MFESKIKPSNVQYRALYVSYYTKCVVLHTSPSRKMSVPTALLDWTASFVYKLISGGSPKLQVEGSVGIIFKFIYLVPC